MSAFNMVDRYIGGRGTGGVSRPRGIEQAACFYCASTLLPTDYVSKSAYFVIILSSVCYQRGKYSKYERNSVPYALF